MAERVLLIDYENVHEAGLKNLPAHDRILLFVGNEQRKANAAKPPADFVDAMMKAGKRLDLIPITETNSNNLDFHMAYYLGAEIAENPQAEYIAISDDDDLDPLLKHLTARGFNCRRVASKKSVKPPRAGTKPVTAAPKKAVPKLPGVNEVALTIKKEPHPPVKRDKVLHYLQHRFNLPEEKAAELLDGLQAAGHLKIGATGKITYSP